MSSAKFEVYYLTVCIVGNREKCSNPALTLTLAQSAQCQSRPSYSYILQHV